MSLWGLAGICNYCLCRHSITANERVTGLPACWQRSLCAGSSAWPAADSGLLYSLRTAVHRTSTVSPGCGASKCPDTTSVEFSRRKSILLLMALSGGARPGPVQGLSAWVTSVQWLGWVVWQQEGGSGEHHCLLTLHEKILIASQAARRQRRQPLPLSGPQEPDVGKGCVCSIFLSLKQIPLRNNQFHCLC